MYALKSFVSDINAQPTSDMYKAPLYIAPDAELATADNATRSSAPSNAVAPLLPGAFGEVELEAKQLALLEGIELLKVCACRLAFKNHFFILWRKFIQKQTIKVLFSD